jgi:hypothetical protein
VQAEVEEDLTDLVLARALPLDALGDRGELSARVRRRVRDRLLSEVEITIAATRRRADEKRALPAIDEWREWNALRAQYERGVRLAGEDLRRLAFLRLHDAACALAVWLFNERGEKPIGNAIFRFLLAEAHALGDERAVDLQSRNVEVSF